MVSGKAIKGVLVSGQVYGYLNGELVKYVKFEDAIKMLGISKPSFYDWLKKGRIRWDWVTTEIKEKRVSLLEIQRCQKLIEGGWTRAKGKTKVGAKKAGRK